MNFKRVLGLSLAAFAAACGGSSSLPHSPTAPAPVVENTYVGHYRVTACGSLCGWVGPSWPFSLTLTGTLDQPTAVIRTEPWGLEATLTGRRQPDGLLLLTGAAPSVGDIAGASFDVVVREEAAGGLTGTFSYAVTRASAPGMTLTAEIVSAVRGAGAPPAQDLSGTWAGTGRNERLCTSDWGCTDPAFGVMLVKQGAGYAGLAQINTRGAQRLSILVTGAQEGPSLVLRGSLPKSPGQLFDIGQDVTRLALRTLPSGEMVGDYELIEYQSTYSTTHRGALLGGSRRPSMPAGTFTGNWNGQLLHESCVGDCRLLYHTGIPVSLTQSGASVDGRYANEFALTGSVSGTSLVLEGGDTTPGCVAKSGAVCSESLRIVVTGMDAWGMISGTASHTWNGKFDSYTRTGRLWNFTRQIQ